MNDKHHHHHRINDGNSYRDESGRLELTLDFAERSELFGPAVLTYQY